MAVGRFEKAAFAASGLIFLAAFGASAFSASAHTGDRRTDSEPEPDADDADNFAEAVVPGSVLTFARSLGVIAPPHRSHRVVVAPTVPVVVRPAASTPPAPVADILRPRTHDHGGDEARAPEKGGKHRKHAHRRHYAAHMRYEVRIQGTIGRVVRYYSTPEQVIDFLHRQGMTGHRREIRRALADTGEWRGSFTAGQNYPVTVHVSVDPTV